MFVFLAVVLIWIISLCLHEYSHARTAYEGGDTSVAAKGYLSFNPFAYMDPVNSVLLPIVFLALGGMALPGGAVWIDRSRLRTRRWETAVSLAGPAANLVMCLLLALPFMLGIADASSTGGLWQVLAVAAYFQLIAVLLNLLPVPGLDGYGALEPWLPPAVVEELRPYRRYGIFLLFILFLATGFGSWLFVHVGLGVMDGLGVPANQIIAGYRAFRFWEQ
jgi:Zn-dependent protease